MKFTEAQLESAIIELLEAGGDPHVLGGKLEFRESDSAAPHSLSKLKSPRKQAGKFSPRRLVERRSMTESPKANPP